MFFGVIAGLFVAPSAQHKVCQKFEIVSHYPE